MLRKPTIFVACLGLCAATIVGVNHYSSTQAANSETRIDYVEDSEVFPGSEFEDWVTYADQVSTVEVVSESRMEPEVGVDRTHVGREVTVIVKEDLWIREGNEPLGEITFVANGWNVRDSGESEIWPAHGRRLEVGSQYVLPLFNQDGEWGVLNSDSVILLDGDSPDAESLPTEHSNRGITDSSVAKIEDDLAATEPDPLLEKVPEDLSPIERVGAIGEIQSDLESNKD